MTHSITATTNTLENVLLDLEALNLHRDNLDIEEEGDDVYSITASDVDEDIIDEMNDIEFNY